MALETPVIATDVGGTAELVRDGIDGCIVPAGDRGALVRATAAALAAPALAASRAREARRRVETTLSFDARMAAVEAIYVELHQRRRPINAAPVVRAQV
jgi:glycosyltransferase involved in cell wall biosynthesis